MVGFNKRTIKDTELNGKRVLLRADYNVPVKKGVITDDYRLKQSLETVGYILGRKPACLIIVSHLGRPEAKEEEFSLAPVAKHLSKLLGKKVAFLSDCLGDETKNYLADLKDGEVALLENLRFYRGEENNDHSFAEKLFDVTQADVFVQDGFGVVHRAHASTEAITNLLPSVGGLLLEREVGTITKVMSEPDHPLVAIIGGAKIADKIQVIEKMMEIADFVAIGGAMANNFLKAEGIAIGSSLYDKDDMRLTRELLQRAKAIEKKRPFTFFTPVDVVVSASVEGKQPTRLVDLLSHSVSAIEAYPKLPKATASAVEASEMILDIGPLSAQFIAGAIELAKTVVWNGTLGVTETKGIAGADKPFSHATRIVAEAIMGPYNAHPQNAFSLVGGGDTVGYIESQGWTEDFSHVSTGGGASLELMSGKKLPGVEALLDKHSD